MDDRSGVELSGAIGVVARLVIGGLAAAPGEGLTEGEGSRKSQTN
jgi:hypothetical protein